MTPVFILASSIFSNAASSDLYCVKIIESYDTKLSEAFEGARLGFVELLAVGTSLFHAAKIVSKSIFGDWANKLEKFIVATISDLAQLFYLPHLIRLEY